MRFLHRSELVQSLALFVAAALLIAPMATVQATAAGRAEARGVQQFPASEGNGPIVTVAA